MKTNAILISALLAAGVLMGCATGAGGGGTVEVNFQNPENFTDMTRTYSGMRGADPGYLEEMRQYLQRTGSNRIPAGHTLSVTITDVDMAGNFEPERGPNLTDVRLMRAVYPPRITLTYRLTNASGAVVSEGEKRLTNLSYDWTISPIDRNDPLRHEKELLNDFLRDVSAEAR